MLDNLEAELSAQVHHSESDKDVLIDDEKTRSGVHFGIDDKMDLLSVVKEEGDRLANERTQSGHQRRFDRQIDTPT